MKRIFYFFFILVSYQSLGQDYLDYQLRLEPVWSRVADALGEPGSVESAEFSPDGKYIVSGTKFDNSVVMWRTSDGAELWRQYAREEIERVGWSSDNGYVAACSEDFLVTVYNSKTGEVVKSLPHGRGIDGLTWSNKGLLLATGEEITRKDNGNHEGWIRIFQMPEGKEVAKINFGNTVNELFFSHDDQLLLAVGHGSVKVYNTADWTLLQTLNPGVYVTFTSGGFSPDAKHVIAVGQVRDGARGNLYIWEWEKGDLLKTVNHTGKKIESVSWHPNGAYIAHAGHDPYIYIYRIRDIMKFANDNIPVAHRVWAGDHAEYIDFNADGSFLVSAHQNGLIKLWVWMGEDPDLNSNRHSWIKGQQSDAEK